MSLLAKLEAKGVKVYKSTPLWEQLEVIATVPISNSAVVVENTKFEGHSLAIEENNQRMYIPLKNGIMPDKESYQLVEFRATRDWEEYNIQEGDTKVFAI